MDAFFCIGCERLLSLAHAAVLFRTGYYRVTFRLGCCAACGERVYGQPAVPGEPQRDPS